MQLDNVYKLFAYVEKVPWIQTFWFVILVMSLVLSLCLTCCSNTDIRCCCFCCNVFNRLLCLARRRKRGKKHNQLRCKICRKSTSSVGVRLGALQNKEVFCWIISEWFIRITDISINWTHDLNWRKNSSKRLFRTLKLNSFILNHIAKLSFKIYIIMVLTLELQSTSCA